MDLVSVALLSQKMLIQSCCGVARPASIPAAFGWSSVVPRGRNGHCSMEVQLYCTNDQQKADLFIYLFISLHVTAELNFSVKPELGLIEWFVLTQVLVLVGVVPPQPGCSQGLRNTQARVSEGVCLVCR